jgi:xylulokinase
VTRDRWPVVLGIDLGTSAVKAAVFSLTGEVRSECTRSYDRAFDAAWSDRNPRGWWVAACDALLGVSQELEGSDVLGLGVSGQIGTHVLANSAGEPIGPAYPWSDAPRAREESSEPIRTALAQETQAQLPQGGPWPLERLLWLQRNCPKTLADAAYLLQPKDLLIARLTGEVVSDPSSWRGLVRPDGSRTPQMAALGLPDVLPAMRRPEQVAGVVGPTAAALSGLPIGTKVYTGWNDMNCSLLGAGLTSSTAGFDITGTSEHLGQLTDDPRASPVLVSYPFVISDAAPCHMVYGVSSNCGSVLSWLRGLLGLPANDGHFAGAVETMLKQTSPGNDGLIMRTHLYGERSPVWDAGASAALQGLRGNDSGANLVRAGLEGVVFNLREILDETRRTQPPLDTYRTAGGPSALRGWNQIRADILDVSIEVPRDREASRLGAAMLAAFGAGAFSDLASAASAMTSVEVRLEPNPHHRQVYDDAYQTYLEHFSARDTATSEPPMEKR